MENAQQILVYSFALVAVVVAVLVFKITFSAYGSIMGDSRFKYRFDKARLPACLFTIIALAVLSLCFGFVVSRDIGLAAEFCVGVTISGGIGSMLKICYVPK